MIQPLWRMVWRFLKKLKIELPYDPCLLYTSDAADESEGVERRGTSYTVVRM